jgi:N-succinyldiaminopimelate aminotransferase
MRAPLTRRLAGFGTTIFTEMTRLAQEHGAINLAQGFPDFDGPDFVKEAAKAAIDAGQNQYARMTGLPALNLALAQRYRHHYGLNFDPDREIVVTSGCTEAIFASIAAICDVGDEVILFQPYYDSYRASVCMAGAIPKVVTLLPPDGTQGWHFDPQQLERAFSERTRAILLNSPHNPTGKVFTRQELELIAQLCRKYNVICISDEVYEHLVYSGVHTPMATLLPELTITLSSLGKSFSLTGWKIGWACAPAPLAAAVRSAHQFITFATATPFQVAAAVAVAAPDDFFVQLQREYRERRDYLTGVLQEVGLEVWEPEGTYFTCASLRGTGYTDDFAFAKHLIAHGVATIPPSAFYEQPELGRGYVRFAFCKRRETLEAAAERLRAWRKL